MSQNSHRLSLPYIMPGQAQKHVTVNETVRALDVLVHASAISRAELTPPPAPAEGDVYLIPEGGTDDFEGKTDYLAAFIDGAWMSYPPVQGLIVNIEDEGVSLVRRGEGWDLLSQGGDIDISALTFEIFGINGEADEYNRLLLNSHASLFNHSGAGHQMKINKAAAGDTGSVLFQTAFSGRAELGLAGEDNLSFKVSADGSNWTQAMVIDGASGAARFPASANLNRPVIFNMFSDGGRFAGKPEPLDVRLSGPFEAPNYIKSFNGSVITEGAKFIDNSDDYGGNRGVMTGYMLDLAAKIKPGASASVLRYGTEFYTMAVTAGAGTGSAITVGGTAAHLALSGLRFPLPSRFTLSYWARPNSGQCFLSIHNQARTFIDGIEIFSHTELPLNTWSHVTRVLDYDPTAYMGYEASPYRLYLTPGGGFDLAAPVLFPGQVSPDAGAPLGVVSSLTAFM